MKKKITFAYYWANHNIGDITISKGFLNLIKNELPDYSTNIILRYYQKGTNDYKEAERSLKKDFPDINIVGAPTKELFSSFQENEEKIVFKNTLIGENAKFENEGLKFHHQSRFPISNLEEKDELMDVLKGNKKFLDTTLSKHLNDDFLSAIKESDLVFYGPGMVYNSGGCDGSYVTPEVVLHTVLPILLASEMNIPYGINQSFESIDDGITGQFLRKLLLNADYVFCRDGDSLRFLKEKRILCSKMGFYPDTTVCFESCDDTWAKNFIETNDLKSGKFIIFVPWFYYLESRLYYYSVQAAVLLDEIVEKTDIPVVIVPPQTSELSTIEELLVPQLSEKTRERSVILKEYWSPSEAKALIGQSRIVISMDNHISMLSVPAGIPTINITTYFYHLGRKFHLFKDIGLSNFLYDFWEDPISNIIQTALWINSNWDEAKEMTTFSGDYLKKRAKESIEIIQKIIETK